MYDGYNFSGTSIYNPWSILNYASKKILEPYWINSSGNGLIIQLLSKTNEENKIEIEKLIQGESIQFHYDGKITYKDFDRNQSLDIILNLLFASGYLTFDQIKEELFENKVYIRVPNHEVRDLLLKIITYEFSDDSSQIYRYIDAFTYGMAENNKEKIEDNLNKLLISKSFMDSGESFYHGYTLGIFSILFQANYIVKSNREAGNGRYDVLVEKKDKSFGCIFEFKIAESESEMETLANIAKEQMKEKEYYKELELDKVQNIKEYAVVFCDKKCIVR